MQNKIVLLSIYIFLVSSFISAQTSITIPSSNNPVGTGTQNFTSYRKPLSAYFGYERSAMIYKAKEIGTSGTITSIGFYCDSIKYDSISMVKIANMPVKIFMKEISDTAFSSPTTVFSEETNSTLVYSGNITAAQFVQKSFLTINLTTPFIYSGNKKNLEIIIETNAGGTGGDGSKAKAFRYNRDTTNYLFQYWQEDNTAPDGTGALNYNRPNIQLNIKASTTCVSPTVSPKVTAADSSLCKGNTFALLLSDYTAGTGQGFQWQVSSSGSAWNNIANAVSPFYSSSLDSSAYYRCVFTCNSKPTGSTQVKLDINPLTQCYCYASLAGNCNTGNVIDSNAIVSVSILNTTLSNSNTGCNNLNGLYYSVFPASGNTTCTLTAGEAYTISIQVKGNDAVSMWIDYNQNGIFESKEWTQLCAYSDPNTRITKNFIVPEIARNGPTGLRIRSRVTGVLNDSTSACSPFGTGETEDYTVTITGSSFGINNLVASTAEINIYPNPNNGIFTLATKDLNHTTQLEIFNVNGEMILREIFPGSPNNQLKTIDLSKQGSGIYFVRLISNGGVYNKKVIVY